jgi:hypothetical protein
MTTGSMALVVWPMSTVGRNTSSVEHAVIAAANSSSVAVRGHLRRHARSDPVIGQFPYSRLGCPADLLSLDGDARRQT